LITKIPAGFSSLTTNILGGSASGRGLSGWTDLPRQMPCLHSFSPALFFVSSFPVAENSLYPPTFPVRLRILSDSTSFFPGGPPHVKFAFSLNRRSALFFTPCVVTQVRQPMTCPVRRCFMLVPLRPPFLCILGFPVVSRTVWTSLLLLTVRGSPVQQRFLLSANPTLMVNARHATAGFTKVSFWQRVLLYVSNRDMLRALRSYLV